MNRVTEKHLLVPDSSIAPVGNAGEAAGLISKEDIKSGWLTHTRRMRSKNRSNLIRRVIASEPLKLANSTGEKPQVKKKIA